ncbi:hydrogenase small subunit [Desulfobacula toluolica]|uniref:HysA: periplasmic [NiFeSe] hydrogenase, small subunit n=1 Tax=Desulfobacula toluolica (strain DSM 7467 / Tol2) TaxID=651182 RepID=K0NKJ9_DESTT|nr:hydrogenase small subunit [Desulfobacula toluolica]CCK82076.1 HysA: periplasmic [NiFeSe] hydrogenase, small subunit [Desulfobacula toluolica Tol2]
MIDRREFLKMAACLSASFGISNFPGIVNAALKKITPENTPQLIYLQGQSCTGCSISLLQAESPDAVSMVTQYSKLSFHADLSAASGKQALKLIEEYISGDAGEYFLAVEGAIPWAMPEACVIGDKPFADYLTAAAKTMNGAVAVGTCAVHGGIPAAEGNLTDAVSLKEFYKRKGINPLLIDIPGCPVHPDWVWKTIIHLAQVGLPELINGRPKLFFQRKVHELCPRYHDFQQEIFAEKLGDKGCLFKLGCLGPDTYADCPTRWWNGGQTWCIDANAPCIGCASSQFASKKNFPFYRSFEQAMIKNSEDNK